MPNRWSTANRLSISWYGVGKMVTPHNNLHSGASQGAKNNDDETESLNMETNSSLNSDNPSAARKSVDVFNAEDRIAIVRDHYVRKGYRVHSGLQFGCELVLYADDPSRVHSDFCVHIVPYDGKMDIRTLQTLVRSMPDFHKRLIVASIVPCATNNSYEVKEVSFSSQHAPFRQKAASHAVGEQRKPQNIDTGDECKSVNGNTN